MTKKRFVKLMMAIGYSRNKANEIAASVAGTGRSYCGTWRLYKLKINIIFNDELWTTAMKQITEAIMGLSGSVASFCRGISLGLNSID